MLEQSFFNQEPIDLARALIGKVLRHRVQDPLLGRLWLAAMILETEAYYMAEKGSHSSLGYTESRRAMFMPPGTVYMYYARGGDSLNFSAQGEGNGVLIKSGKPWLDARSGKQSLELMHRLNPVNGRRRRDDWLCKGQTLICRSLGLKVKDWNAKQLSRRRFLVEDVGYKPAKLVQTTRLGIPTGRDEALPYRFVDHEQAALATRNPLTQKAGVYKVVNNA